jgi:hypothetical protein
MDPGGNRAKKVKRIGMLVWREIDRQGAMCNVLVTGSFHDSLESPADSRAGAAAGKHEPKAMPSTLVFF